MDKSEHWENVYQTKSSDEVSWYEPDPKNLSTESSTQQVPHVGV